MNKKMLINVTLSGEERVAIVEDGLLTELDIEVAGSENTKGNIYKAEVVRIEPGLQAAFVNYGAQRHGFLQIGDIHPDLWPKRDGNNSQRPPINEILRRGQQILVQVVKEERGTKGAAVTTELSLAGRYMVLMANSRSRGISRKIDNDSTRKKIKEALKELNLPEEMGYIIRTAAIDQSPEELKRDFNYLFNIYKNIISQAENASAPALVYQESSLVLRSVRDYFTPDMDEVLIDDKEVFKQTRDFFKTVMPDHVKLVKLHQERRPIFSRYQIEEQIAQLATNSVNLPSGGSIVLDQTEALVAIDVNSGKVSSEQSIESTACLVNVEAATEIARQLRLRDLGGLIVIDFIDMRQRKNARKVEKTLEAALKQDKARITQGRISSQFGLLEMSRQRIKPNLGASSYKSCPHCSGSGRIRCCESRAISLLRRIQAGTAKGKIDRVVASVALDVGTMLLNQKRSELKELEQQQNIEIWVTPQPDYLPDQVDLDFIKDAGDHDDTSTEQKALVDMDYSERSRDYTVDLESTKTEEKSADEPQDKSSAPAENQKEESKNGSSQNENSQNGDSSKPRRPRRSRSSRHRRSRSDAKTHEQENQSAATPETPAAEQQPQALIESKSAQESSAQKETANAAGTPQASPSTGKEEQHSSVAEPARADVTKGSETPQRTGADKQESTAKSSASTSSAKPDTPAKTQADAQSSTPEGTKAVAPQSQDTAVPEDKSAPEEGVEKPKPKSTPRRSPSRAKTQSNASEAKSTQEQDDAGAQEQPKTAPVRKRAPARRRTAPKQDSAASAPPAETTSAKASTSAKTPPQEVASAPATEDESKKTPAPRKRTPRKRTPSKQVADAASDSTAMVASDQNAPTEAKEQAVSADAKDTTTPAEKKTAPVRRRRTTSKSASPAAVTTEDSTASDASSAPAAEKTPRRRATTTRSKSAPSTSPTAGPEAEAQVPATKPSEGTQEGDPKPAPERAPRRTPRRTTTRRSTTSKAATSAKDKSITAAPEDQGDKQAADSASTTEAKSDTAPKRRRTTTRKTTPAKTEDDAL